MGVAQAMVRGDSVCAVRRDASCNGRWWSVGWCLCGGEKEMFADVALNSCGYPRGIRGSFWWGIRGYPWVSAGIRGGRGQISEKQRPPNNYDIP